MEKLISCPFCGNGKTVGVMHYNTINHLEPEDTEYMNEGEFGYDKSWTVCCPLDDGGCGATGCFGDKESAVKSWNRRFPLCTLVQPEDIRCGKYFIRNDSWRMNMVYFVDVSPSGQLIVFSRSDKPGTVEDYVLRGYTFFRIPQVPQLEVE